jgi:dTDP-4-dehydrorhamnose reductase
VRILLAGRNGQVGYALERALALEHELIALDRTGLDLSDLEAIGRALDRAKPQVVVNAAAYTAVDRAEREPDAVFRINAQAVQALGLAANRAGALVVHYSTDYVFDGEKRAPYTELDEPNPLSVYGASKLAGERLLAASGCRHLILRTSWVYGPRGRNFLHAILAAARTRPELRVVNDQRGAPTSSLAIAKATGQLLSSASFAAAPGGVYHMSAAGETTWHGFARAIVEAAGLRVPVIAISSAEYPGAARRPANSLLDNAKLRATFGVTLADWREELAGVMRVLH